MADEIVYVIIPAVPGFEVLEYHHNGGGPDALVDRHPVVAWRIDPTEGSDYAEPITPETPLNRNQAVIKYPDGSVNWPACQTWGSEEAWLASAREEAQKACLKLVNPF